MYWLGIFFIFILVVGTPNSLENSCTRGVNECRLEPEFKYFFFEVSNQEGFNLRRDVYMRYAIMFSEMHKRNDRLNWKLVLPPFHRLPHWQNENFFSDPVQWSSLFDIEALKSYAPVVEIAEILKDNPPKIDIDRVYSLQNYENAFENGKFDEKWNIVKCPYLSQSFWGYATSILETVCVKFQGKVSKLWEIVSLHPHDKSILINHAEIPLHNSYGTKSYWDCRKSMKFNSTLIQAAQDYIAKHLKCQTSKCDTYMSVHWRRGDFAYGRKNEVPSIIGAAKQIAAAAKKQKLKTKNVFVATDASCSEIQQLQDALKEHEYTSFFYLPSQADLKKFRDGGIAIIEQIICSHAAYFIGSHESTFTYRIQEEREILKFDSSTTFNRLCPDKGRCESPSIWKLIE